MRKIAESKLIKLQSYITLDEASEYLSRLIEEEITRENIRRVVWGRVPLFVSISSPYSAHNFTGFTERSLKKLWPDKEQSSDESQTITIRNADGSIPEHDFWASVLPFPLKFRREFPGVPCTETDEGSVYWFIWIDGDDELVSFSGGFAGDMTEVKVRPRDIFDLATQLNNEEFWPEDVPLFISELEVNRAKGGGVVAAKGGGVKPLHFLSGEWIQSGNNPNSTNSLPELTVSASPHLVIAGMTKLIKEISNNTQDTIHDYIYEMFDGARGTSKSQLQDLFAAANASAKEVKREK